MTHFSLSCIICLLYSVGFLSFPSVHAQAQMTAFPEAALPPIDIAGIAKAFQQYTDLSPKIEVPTIIELSVKPSSHSAPTPFFVIDRGTEIPIASLVKTESVQKAPIITTSTPGAEKLIDRNDSTSYEFYFTGTQSRATVTFNTPEAKSYSGIIIRPEANSALPTQVEVLTTLASGEQKYVIADTPVTGTRFQFPEQAGVVWNVTFTYTQPIRLSELVFQESQPTYDNLTLVRFLAQPGQQYRIYSQPDYALSLPYLPTNHLSFSQDVKQRIETSIFVNNPLYTPSDQDRDGFVDHQDNCPRVANPDQEDRDNNNIGDKCEDFDRDGLSNSTDNCPDFPNTDQQDTDGDRIGDTCDTYENRVTERNPWLPWAGIGIATFVLIMLYAVMIREKQRSRKDIKSASTPNLSVEEKFPEPENVPETEIDTTSPPTFDEPNRS
jgi:hypothetical protein